MGPNVSMSVAPLTKSERSMLKPLIPEKRLRKCAQDVNTILQPPKDCESYINRIERSDFMVEVTEVGHPVAQ
jgi:hypothetical protein